MIGIKNFSALAANASVTFNGFASFVRCLTGNNSMRVIARRGSATIVDFDGFQAGLLFRTPIDPNTGERIVCDTFELTNGSTQQTIALAIGDGDVEDNRLVGTVNITGGLLSKALGEDTSDGFGTITVANGVATLIKAAGTQAGSCLVQNKGAVDIAIGWANTVTYANGIVIPPGSSVSVSGAIAIYGIGNGASADTRYLAGKYA